MGRSTQLPIDLPGLVDVNKWARWATLRPTARVTAKGPPLYQSPVRSHPACQESRSPLGVVKMFVNSYGQGASLFSRRDR